MNGVVSEATKYLFYYYTGVKNNLAYKWDFIFNMIFKLGFPLIMLAVWSAIYLSSGASTIGGFGLAQTYSYFFALSLLGLFIDENLEWIMLSDISSGHITTLISKPVNYIMSSVAWDLSWTTLQVLIVGVPLGIIIVTLLHITLSPAYLAVLAVEALVALFFLYSLGALMGTLSLYLTNASGVYSIVYQAISFLSGLFIPLNFFPQEIGSALLRFLPFQITAYTPAATFLQEISIDQALGSTAVALVWAAGFCLLAYLFWKASIKRIALAGG